MIIKDLLNELSKPGQTVAGIAKQIEGVGEKRLKNALNQVGYRFRNQSPKEWFFAAEGSQPLDKSIFDYVKPDSHSYHTETHKPGENNTPDVNSISHTGETNVKDYSKLMYDELKAIRSLLQKHNRKNTVNVSNDLLERISGLNKAAEKTRKTIVIDKTISEQLDQFAKEKRVTKSNLLELALLDLFNRYK